VAPPIFENSLFVYENFRDLAEALKNQDEHYIYTRGVNPTVEILEKKLAALEHGDACKCFSSGMAAISASMSAYLKQGDHILFVNNIYGPALSYAKYIEKYGITHTIVYDLEGMERETRDNTRVIYVESPGTMTFKMLDLKRVSEFARQGGIITMIDNTWATPMFQKPIDLGIDISLHSCSKYIGGHSDVVAGAAISSRENIRKIWENEYMLRGGCIGPFEAWLLMRGLRTLPVRMQKFQENAMKVAEFLHNHKSVERVNYPGLPSDSGYELGKKQLKGYSGLMSFEVKTEKFEEIAGIIDACRVFKIGVSWGGFESLITSPYNGENYRELKESRISPSLIRISVGLESVDSMVGDLEQALDTLKI
jgi:cystathionine beta-lyase/cystathionine gamma-synthase